MATKNKRKDPKLYTYDKYECWWEDATSHSEWKDIQEAKLDKPTICYTEGYVLTKNKDYHTFVMSFALSDVGEQMIVPTKNIKKLKRVGTKTFYVSDFEYETYQNES